MELYHIQQQPEGAAKFCRTPVAGEILQVLDLACQLRAIGTIVGAPGVGKTTTLSWYADNNRGVGYCTMNTAQASMSRVLALVGSAFGGTPAPGARPEALYDAICAEIRWSEPAALIIDEAQHLSDRCLDALRSIHDETGLPMVFAGNESLRSRITVSSASAFAQFASRVGARLDIEGTTAADVDALADHYGIAGAEARRWLRKRCTGIAGLRMAGHLLTIARGIVGKGEIELTHLKDAAAVLGSGA